MDGLTLPLVDDAALHDQIGTGHHGDVLQRITVKGHQVAMTAGGADRPARYLQALPLLMALRMDTSA